MDIRDLKFEDSSFDIAIDKGEPLSSARIWRMKSLDFTYVGTMDAMMTSKGDVWVTFCHKSSASVNNL